ncbi:MAG: Na(+)/H(+) antiporter subunit D [Nibricoccus sp.]
MSDLWVHPSLVFLIGGLILTVLPQAARKAWLILVPALAFGLILKMSSGTFGVLHVAGFELTFGRVDHLSQVFAHIMGLMAIIGTLYGLHVKRPVEHLAAWTYVAGSMGAIYAGDFVTLFLFWELMAIASTFLIWFRKSEKSIAAGYRYLLVHMAGGVALLAGIMLTYRATHSLAFNPLDVANPAPGTWLIMIGFILNAAVPPLHAWLPDAYGEATFNGSVFMCAFTTKTAVYALLRGVPGFEILIPLGVIMALYGVVYAVLENDSRRLLAYHIISQVGYMVAGVGLANTHTAFGQLAFNGACAHAFAHILYKGLLFMGCGTVLHQTGESKFTELGGLYKKMPWTFVLTLIGGLSISAFPLFSGFVSKSMIVSAGFDSGKLWVGFLLMLASAGTFLHTGLKVPYYIFFGKNNCKPQTWEKAKDPVWNMTAAMAIAAFFCIFIGSYTPYLYNMLPFQGPAEEYAGRVYGSAHVMETLQILLFTALGFFLMLKKLTPEAKISLDLDIVWRKGGPAFLWLAKKPIQAVDNFVGEIYNKGGLIPLMRTSRLVGIFDGAVIDGIVDGFATSFRNLGAKLRGAQRGAIQDNLTVAFAAAAVLLVAFIFIF